MGNEGRRNRDVDGGTDRAGLVARRAVDGAQIWRPRRRRQGQGGYRDD